jgi:type II secretory pathway component GspD/PulD (secretin)
MKRLICCLLLAFTVVGGAGAKRPADSLDSRISLDLDTVSATDVLGSLGRVLGLPVDIDPAIESPVTLKLVDVRLRTALNAVCDSLRCGWRIEAAADGERRLRFTAIADNLTPVHLPASHGLAERLTLSLAEAPLGSVLETLARVSGGSAELDPSLADQKVTIELKLVPARDAIETLAKMHRLRVEVVSEEPLVLRFSAGD